MKRILHCTFLGTLLFFGGCLGTGSFTKDPNVYIRPSNVLAYEIELKRHVTVYGNVHQPTSIERHEYDESDYIYVNAREGRVEAADFVFQYYRPLSGPVRDTYLQQLKTSYPFKGHLEFRGNTVLISLQAPRWKDGSKVPGYETYGMNGEYNVLNR